MTKTESIDTLWRVYTMTNEWVRFADAKVGAVLAFEGVVLSILSRHLDDLILFIRSTPLFLIGVIPSAVLIGCSWYFGIKCLIPTVDIGDMTSLIFFGRIAKDYSTPRQYEDSVKEVFKDNSHITSQLTQQIWATARIAQKKYIYVGMCIKMLRYGVVIGFITTMVGHLLF